MLGANLGTALNPLLEGAAGGGRRRPPGAGGQYGHAARRRRDRAGNPAVDGAVAVVVWEPDPARAVADLHTAFNLVLAALFFPLLPAYAALLRIALPHRVEPADPSRPLYLDESALETPVVAVGAAAREALRLADMLEHMLHAAGQAFVADDRKRVAEARRMDDVLDRLNSAIKAYLTSLDPEALSAEDQRRIEEILAFTTNLEHAGRRAGQEPARPCGETAEAKRRPGARAGCGADGHHCAAGRQTCAPGRRSS